MTIAQVAKHAGVSVATVSLVIKNNPKVSPATAAAVRASMAALGFNSKPETVLPPKSSPPVKKVGRVALLSWGFSESMLQMSVYLDLLCAVEETLREHGLGMMLYHAGETDRLGLDNLKSTVDGMILLGSNLDDCPETLRDMSCVRVMGGLDPRNWYDHVTCRNEAIGPLAAKHLLKCGHRSCAVLAQAPMQGIWKERVQTFCATIEGGGGKAVCLEEPALMVPRGDAVDRNRMISLVDRLLAVRPKPTGVFIPADILTLSAYVALLNRNVRPGKDLHVVSCNNEPAVLRALHPRPSVIDIRVKEIGRRAVEQLLWRIQHPKEPRANITVEPELIPSDDHNP